jgi:TonB family protein
MTESTARAERLDLPSSGGSYYIWQVPQKPIAVRLPLALIDRLEQQTVESFRSLTSRGSEIGGLLLGGIAPGNPATVSVEDFELIACDYSRGPLYRLSDADMSRFEKAIEQHASGAGLRVTGFFRSHTRKGLSLDAEDVSFFEPRFHDPNQIVLLVRPFATKASAAGIFIRENGRVSGDASLLEFPFRSSELGGGTRRVESAPPAAPPPPQQHSAPEPNRAPARAQIVPIASRREMQAPEPELLRQPESRQELRQPEPRQEPRQETRQPEARQSQPAPQAPPPVEAKAAPPAPPAAKVTPAPPAPAARVAPSAPPAPKVSPAPQAPPAAKMTPPAAKVAPAQQAPAPKAAPAPVVPAAKISSTPPAVKAPVPEPPTKKKEEEKREEKAKEKEKAVAPAPAPAPKVVEPAPVAAVSRAVEPANKNKKVRLIVAAAVAMIVLVGGFLFVYPALTHKGASTTTAGTQDTSALGLHIDHTSDGLLLSWNNKSTAIQHASKVVLTITDGDRKENIEMDPNQVRTGSFVYTPISGDVSFQMEVADTNQTRTSSESIRMHDPRPSPLATTATPATTTAAVAPTKGNSKNETPTTETTATESTPKEEQAVTRTPTPTKQFDKESLATRLRPAAPADIAALGDAPTDGRPNAAVPGNLGSLVTGSASAPNAPSAPARPAATDNSAANNAAATTTRNAAANGNSGGQITPAEATYKKAPEYPKVARQIGASGVVEIEATVGVDGRLKNPKVLKGNQMLQKAAIDAVLQWKYKPALLNGKPVESPVQIKLNFTPDR